MIHSVAGMLPGGALTDRRPFRAPHHSASMAALVGGGHHAKPGEISLAHQGVLFLDELPEFSAQALDSLRQPLETGEVALARANHRIVYPARFQLIAAMNPCRCGHADDPGYACARGPVARCAAQYQARLSGPLIDRFDLTHRRRRRHRRRSDAPAAGRGLARGRRARRGGARAAGRAFPRARARRDRLQRRRAGRASSRRSPRRKRRRRR